jgi:hypothetical protein
MLTRSAEWHGDLINRFSGWFPTPGFREATFWMQIYTQAGEITNTGLSPAVSSCLAECGAPDTSHPVAERGHWAHSLRRD